MNKRILLCDDEVFILRAAEIKLKHAGYEVDTAADGEEGWQRMTERRPDFVVTDCQMPRLDGLGLIQRMREHAETRDIPALMLTAKGFELSRDELAAKWNVITILHKPFSPRELLQIVSGVLNGQPVAST
jgi:DNA-binding response OmpR family regulator